MLDPKKVRLGICPIGWSNDDMWDLGDENTFQQCISEMKLAGFDGCEVGHKYPEDKKVLKHMLDVRNMTIASKWFSSKRKGRPAHNRGSPRNYFCKSFTASVSGGMICFLRDMTPGRYIESPDASFMNACPINVFGEPT